VVRTSLAGPRALVYRVTDGAAGREALRAYPTSLQELESLPEREIVNGARSTTRSSTSITRVGIPPWDSA